MIEKVNPCHPDKVADRIAGAIVDYAYSLNENPKIAVEVLIGHGQSFIIVETSEALEHRKISAISERISGITRTHVTIVEQDKHLAKNQSESIKCGDNGIFKGCPLTEEQAQASYLARSFYDEFKSDGKYIVDMENHKVVICQSNMKTEDYKMIYPDAVINPLGDWTGGTDVDSGATNRKLGSDMGHAVTGGGLHGKDLSKADVSVNIWCHLEAQKRGEIVEALCAIGDETVNGVPYSEIVEIARNYIKEQGGFEKFAEWGLY